MCGANCCAAFTLSRDDQLLQVDCSDACESAVEAVVARTVHCVVPAVEVSARAKMPCLMMAIGGGCSTLRRSLQLIGP